MNFDDLEKALKPKPYCYQCKGTEFNKDLMWTVEEKANVVSMFAYHRRCAPSELLK